MRLYLVGFMGAGKTTVAEGIARRLELPFVDLDEQIEQAVGRSIKQIFSESGEPFFRRVERDVLRATRQLEQAVVATGGGTFASEENIEIIRAAGISVHLAVPFETLARRISEKSGSRPLFADDASAYDLYRKRCPYYRRADLTVDVGRDETAPEVVERILLQLSGKLSNRRSD